MKTIRQKYEMKASPSKVFKALTDAKQIRKWSNAPAKMNAKKGGKFSIWGGDMFGVNLEVVKNKKLVQQWCTSTFESEVSFTLKPKGKNTIVSLVHSKIPANVSHNYSSGWKDYYLGVMQRMFADGEL